EVERRRREQPAAAARLGVADDPERRTLGGGSHRPLRAVGVGAEEGGQARAARQEAVRVTGEQGAQREQARGGERALATDARLDLEGVVGADEPDDGLVPAGRAAA